MGRAKHTVAVQANGAKVLADTVLSRDLAGASWPAAPNAGDVILRKGHATRQITLGAQNLCYH